MTTELAALGAFPEPVAGPWRDGGVDKFSEDGEWMRVVEDMKGALVLEIPTGQHDERAAKQDKRSAEILRQVLVAASRGGAPERTLMPPEQFGWEREAHTMLDHYEVPLCGDVAHRINELGQTLRRVSLGALDAALAEVYRIVGQHPENQWITTAAARTAFLKIMAASRGGAGTEPAANGE